MIDEGLELLDEDECWRLVEKGELGRVGISVSALPAIFPVNYTTEDGAVLFRTSPGTKLAAAARGEVVAFEVDDYDSARRTGWSVLVVGRARVVRSPGAVLSAPEPWADGERTHLVQIRPGFISGRRISR